MSAIVVVDDDPGLQDVVRLALEQDGYEVTVYDNGDALLRNTFGNPRLIILDKLLPGIDGLDICRHMKKQPATRDIPIVMISASPQISGPAKAAGADDFLEKPFSMAALREVVVRYAGTPSGSP